MSAILFRTDGSASIGTGHVMRCLALAQACGDSGHTPIFLGANLSEALVKRIKGERIDVRTLKSSPYGKEDQQETIAAAQSLNAMIVVVDGYDFDARYQTALKDADLTVLFVDDYSHAASYDAQFVLNQNPYAKESMYTKRSGDTTLLLGSKFCLLRREFHNFRSNREIKTKHPLKILLTFGGADPQNATGKVLQALQGLDEPIEAMVIVGGSNPHRPALESAIKSSAFPAYMIVDTTEMPRLMAEADLALCAGGSSCYELAYMQLPMLTVVLAKNQKPVAKSLEEHGCSVNLGDLKDLKSEHVVDAVSALIKNIRKRENMSRACCTLVDGEGVDRVLMNLAGSRVRLRNAQMDDARMLWEWANDPETCQASFTSEEIPWETHKGWFENLMKDLKHKFWIAIGVDDVPVGSIRFALDKADATLSISTAPDHRGKGLGAEMVKAATQKLFATTDAKIIHAYVKPENEASKRLFFKTGFFEETSVKMKENLALHYTLKNPNP